MGNARTFILPVVVVFFLVTLGSRAWAGERIKVVQYELKPVEQVESGKYIKTEWSAKIRNGASESVNFTVTIAFVDSNNEVLKKTSSQCELLAQETKTFKDTLLLESSIASRVASTRVSLDETGGE